MSTLAHDMRHRLHASIAAIKNGGYDSPYIAPIMANIVAINLTLAGTVQRTSAPEAIVLPCTVVRLVWRSLESAFAGVGLNLPPLRPCTVVRLAFA